MIGRKVMARLRPGHGDKSHSLRQRPAPASGMAEAVGSVGPASVTTVFSTSGQRPLTFRGLDASSRPS